ncbi:MULTISPECIES: ATP-binding protein [Actinomadura]|uniref:ATP-binding protein n=1 Tax=Actinomadura yumaensis TaxID=111807 RepID=A0ABW2CT37_9ACTN|nr:ATP-binding protein [Actinomadura sp. J1-007]MWK40497.1 ATP-binding protein [Actinomadura sp. J1-007]
MAEAAAVVVKAVPEAVKEAREFVALVFGEWGLDDHVARTVVSELVTNAIRHGSRDGDPVVVRVFALDGRPVIEVWDRSDAPPVVRPFDPGAENGRGLLLIGALVRRWGARPLAEGGKVVWAECEGVAVARSG